MFCTLIAPGDAGRTSSVANAGELVSPALISPPSPLDLLRIRGLSLLLGLVRGLSLSDIVVERSGNASVAVILDRGIFKFATIGVRPGLFELEV